ncbi:hypothetical protein HHK36_019694 [Tetracentron sinense]|uniref:Myb/SANT-like domain-containing protein n=1 Tax=Tetracentron sinense TaxID=13715 RepID=A0A835D9U3_TETSI|nr:hypothetical protein HHK36_019694 [Tetracentron sinense]
MDDLLDRKAKHTRHEDDTKARAKPKTVPVGVVEKPEEPPTSSKRPIYKFSGMDHNALRTRSDNAKEKGKYTSWTNEMDRCLTKILVEQAKKGNKIDKTLKSATYTAAVRALNDKFALDLTKEHIRSRLKTWKKQYVVLKELLAQSGFEWDETRKMIVANDSVWNDYIKEHPDARTFRARLIENYDELCIIIGNYQATGSCSGTFAELVDLTAKYEGVETDGASQILSCNEKEPAEDIRWTEEMDRCLDKILVEQMKRGNIIDNTLKPEAYTEVVRALNERFQLDMTKDNIRNRLKTLKKQYGVLKELLAQSGFHWDETRKMVTANDSVWNNYIKTHPDARAFQERVIENYDELCMIFGDGHAIESCSRNGDDAVLYLTGNNEEVGTTDASQIWSGNGKEQAKYMRWTNEMDSCLTKILVEQVKQGNKIDNKLKPAAYMAAVTALNERFRIDMTKDHVRNRLKTWKKQYGFLKELLAQSGFKWDETRKMIVANDSLWNDYIKSHPDARAFRAKAFEYYDELCIIIDNDHATESCSRTGAEAELELTADNEVVETAKEKGKYVTWTDEMDRCLTETLVEQVKQGNKLEKSLKAAAYTAAVKALNENFALDLTKENVRNRLKTWKKLYGALKELLAQSGFEWDETRKMVVADDFVWNDYIKSHPDARPFRARSIENYNELCIIIGSDQENRSWSRIGAEVDVKLITENEHVENENELMLADDNISRDGIGDGMEASSQQTRSRPTSSSHSKQPGKKKRDSDAMLETMSAIAANIGRIADALAESNRTAGLDELFEMVQKIPGFDDDLIIEACEYLSFDEKKAKMFFKLDDRLRKKWLLKRLRGTDVNSREATI